MSTEHYHCHKIFCQKTCSERILDMVFFQHHYIMQPTITPEDQVIKACGDMRMVLNKSKNMDGSTQLQLLRKLDQALTNLPPKLGKKFTFMDPISEPRVVAGLQQQKYPKETYSPLPAITLWP